MNLSKYCATSGVILFFLLFLLLPEYVEAQTPIISSVSPEFTCIGDTVTVTGSDFGSFGGSLELYNTWGSGFSISSISWSSTSVSFVVPSWFGTGELVEVQVNSSNLVPFEILDPIPSGYLSYLRTSFCTGEGPAMPGSLPSGGTFSYTGGPSLSIDPTTGEIQPGFSAVGVYTVTFVPEVSCYSPDEFTIVIYEPEVSFGYPLGNYCKNGEPDPVPVPMPVSSGGTYSSPTGLIFYDTGTSFGSTTGQIDLSESLAGLHTITYTYSDPFCSEAFSMSLNVLPPPSPGFFYPTSTICENGENIIPSIDDPGSLSDGVFTDLNSLSDIIWVSSVTGQINTSVTPPDTYTVKRTVILTSGCTAWDTFKITILPQDEITSLSYDAPWCDSDTVIKIPELLPGGIEGMYSVDPPTGLYIDDSTGTIDPGKSDGGSVGDGGIVYSVSFISEGTCPDTFATNVQIIPAPDASFTYPSPFLCLGGSDEFPSYSCEIPSCGHTFSATGGPSLDLDPSTGEIDIDNLDGGIPTAPGVYTISRQVSIDGCVTEDSFIVNIGLGSDPTFSYPGDSLFCTSDGGSTPDFFATVGGVWSSSLEINDSTGFINLSTATVGSHWINYAILGSCSTNSTHTIRVDTLNAAEIGFSYPGTLCENETATILPTESFCSLCISSYSLEPDVGDGFLADAATGELNPDTLNGFISVEQTKYIRRNVSRGGCTLSSGLDSIRVELQDDAIFYYPATVICKGNSNPVPVLTGSLGGSFSSPSLTFIDPGTGEVNLGASLPGIHSITYTTSGLCMDSSTVTIEIIARPDLEVSYPDSIHCRSDDLVPTPDILGELGGAFFTLTSGLNIETDSGIVNPGLSEAGTYEVVYEVFSGVCLLRDTTSVEILDSVSLSYEFPDWCNREGFDRFILPERTPVELGFSVTPSSLGISLDGIIDLSATASPIGVYYIEYSPPSCNSTDTFTLEIVDDSYALTYSTDSLCQRPGEIAVPDSLPISGGTFSVIPSGLTLFPGGIINGELSTLGSYTISYEYDFLGGGRCPNTILLNTEIVPQDTYIVSYPASPYCRYESSALLCPIDFDTLAGYFYPLDGGLVIDTLSGCIDLNASTPGIHSFEFVTNGPCPIVQTVEVLLVNPDVDLLFYEKDRWCNTLDSNVYPTSPVHPAPAPIGGVFYSSTLSIHPDWGSYNPNENAPGIHIISYTSDGICPITSYDTITVDTMVPFSLSYPDSNYCNNESGSVPPIWATPGGGQFTAPAGLDIFLFSGLVDIEDSDIGTYPIVYSSIPGTPGCGGRDTFLLNIHPADDASFSYEDSIYCHKDNNFEGTSLTPGWFEELSGAVKFANESTGEVDLTLSSPGGPFLFVFHTESFCPNTDTAYSFSILPKDSALFYYPKTEYCLSDPDPSPINLGTGGGAYLFTATASSDVMTLGVDGVIDLSESDPGIYEIQYITLGQCPDTAMFEVTLLEAEDPFWELPVAEACRLGPALSPIVTTTPGGEFSWNSPDPTKVCSQNSISGEIQPAFSDAGDYILTYITPGDSLCRDSLKIGFSVIEKEDASFSYPTGTWCPSDSDPNPVIEGTGGGTFSGSLPGLVLDSDTGTINLEESIADTEYEVEYITGGICPDTSIVTVSIGPDLTAEVDYGLIQVCPNEPGVVIPEILGDTGVFLSIPLSGDTSAVLDIDPVSGVITPSGSTPGDFWLLNYWVSDPQCPVDTIVYFGIKEVEDAGFSYGSTFFCPFEDPVVPFHSGWAGGSFSYTSSTSLDSLDLDPFSGVLNPTNSSSGDTFTVSYSTPGECPDTHEVSVVIGPKWEAGIAYAIDSVCQTDSIPLVLDIVGDTGVVSWTYSFGTDTAAILMLDSIGTVYVPNSTSGIYLITNTVGGDTVCSISDSTQLKILAADDPTFSYPASYYCPQEADPVPDLIATPGGIFFWEALDTLTDSLVLNAATGRIDLSASEDDASFLVIYESPGTCPRRDTAIIHIGPKLDASFSFDASTYCQNAAWLPLLSIGPDTGIFLYSVISSPAGSGAFLDMDSTGVTDPSSSSPGTYWVTHEILSSACPVSDSVLLGIIPTDDPSFEYPDTLFCTENPNPAISISGTPNGLFYAISDTDDPDSLALDSISGIIDLGSSPPGLYGVVYQTDSTCPAADTHKVQISGLPPEIFPILHIGA